MKTIIGLNKNQFYKAKDYVNGMPSPGGYLYTVEVTKDKVRFIALEEPKLDNEKHGVFAVSHEDFCNVVEAQVFNTMRKN
ncbi:MAG: hypothetical protein E7190_03380 [Erysipelotrichaceae bacterium]|nr:hypothetical protein [Erysipelotrichaceae bacterium]